MRSGALLAIRDYTGPGPFVPGSVFAEIVAAVDEIERQSVAISRVRELADELDAVYPNVSQSIRAALGDDR